MEENSNQSQLFETLLALCDDVAWNRAADVDRLYQLTRPDAGPEPLIRLAEAFGLMLVKVEGREFTNARLLEELQARNEELEQARTALLERNIQLVSQVRETFSSKNMVAQCAAMRRVVDLALSIARRPVNTLIVGPTGSGKEVVAKIIHNNSPRYEGPFVAINCTAIPDALFESEMFGIEKGVATGVSARKGLMEEAHGGTLFFDELGEMSLPHQAKLLRVLEEREVMRVGSSKAVPVDIKIIAATNVSLPQAIEEGRFREDLYYRINVVEVVLPPLRERGDDILLLAQSFLDKHSAQVRRERMTISPAARQVLMAYDWPGNVRELNNEMERAAALTIEHSVVVSDLSERIQKSVNADAVAAVDAAPMLPDIALEVEPGKELNLEYLEKKHVMLALEQAQGNRSQAARLLGLTREGLRKKLLRMQLPQ